MQTSPVRVGHVADRLFGEEAPVQDPVSQCNVCPRPRDDAVEADIEDRGIQEGRCSAGTEKREIALPAESTDGIPIGPGWRPVVNCQGTVQIKERGKGMG